MTLALGSWAVATSATSAVVPAPAPDTPGPGVADVLANRPAAGASVELDAYFSGAGAPSLPGGPVPVPGKAPCPDIWYAMLGDRPFQAYLPILNGTQSNALPDNASWLITTTPDATQPYTHVRPQLPYHARLRGHLGDSAFDHCRRADRIFVIEKVFSWTRRKGPRPRRQ